MQKQTNDLYADLCRPWEHQLSRRKLLGSAAAAGAGALGMGALGSGSLGLGNLLSAAETGALKKKSKQVLFVWIDGGMSQFESWDPKPNSEFGGPFRAIDTSVAGIKISELMPQTAKQMHHLSIVRSMCTKDNAHSSGVARIQRGDPKNRGVVYPFFGSAVAKFLGQGSTGLPPYVSIKPGSGGFIYQDAGFLGPKYGALAFGDGKPPENLLRSTRITSEDDEVRNAMRRSANARYAEGRPAEPVEAMDFVFDTAQELMKRSDLFDDAKFSPQDRQRYGETDFGRHMLQARKFLEAGVTFVKVTSNGWDTHGDNFNGHADLMPKFDRAFAAMIEDLATRGMLDDVLVICMSEFGRTPRINGHVGRDHFPEAWSLATTGPGIRRGNVVGGTNGSGAYVTGPEHDIGHLFHSWFKVLGIDSKKDEYDNAGQPLPIAHDDCFPVPELLS
ncbi:MAG: DUF1501 domain-containing protein [Planctomycetia bacterium]|nr:DUF1501 domain-containing protein [Planctomycetia bacterium]